MHLPPAVNSFLLGGLYSAICGTLRISEENRRVVDELDARGERMIFCLWHDELFSLIPVSRQIRVVAIVSPSKDGEVLARILASKNVGAVHGSSTRGGVRALLKLAHMMKHELVHACITMDGPAGPRHEAKEGALFLANRTGAHILPVRIFVKHHIKLPTWDKFQVPLPFSKVIIRFGTPWGDGREEVPDLEAMTLARARKRLENDIRQLGQGFIPGESA